MARESGVLGEMHPLTAEKFGIEGRVYLAEIRLENAVYGTGRPAHLLSAAAAPSCIGT